MTQEKVDLINRLMEIEERIEELWEFHPDNPDAIDVVDEFKDSGFEVVFESRYTKPDIGKHVVMKLKK